jgi:hypothetical protein
MATTSQSWISCARSTPSWPPLSRGWVASGTHYVDTRELCRWVLVVEAKVSLHDEVLTEVRANHGATGGGPISSLMGSGAVVVFGPA